MIPNALYRSTCPPEILEHPGLIWTRLGPPAQRDVEALAGQLAGKTPPGYGADNRRWRRATISGALGRKVLFLRTEGRLTLGLGEQAPGEIGFTFHHTYGVPYLPGSSLKGLARAWCAHTRAGTWGEGQPDFNALFGVGGDTGEGGTVDFLDALPEPDYRLVLEVATPHNGKYYSGIAAPTGFDNPIPARHLAVQGTFRVVLEGPEPWADIAGQFLLEACREWGVGAKTRAGYGRLAEAPEPPIEAQLRRDLLPPPLRLRELLRTWTVVDALAPRIAQWMLGEEAMGNDPLASMRQADPTIEDRDNRRYLVDWLQEHHIPRQWARKDSERNGRLLATLAEWGLAEPDEPGEVAEERRTTFGTEHMDPSAFPPRLDPNKFSRQIGTGRYDEATVRAAIAYLQDQGAKPGHLRNIWRAYELPEGWPDAEP